MSKTIWERKLYIIYTYTTLILLINCTYGHITFFVICIIFAGVLYFSSKFFCSLKKYYTHTLIVKTFLISHWINCPNRFVYRFKRFTEKIRFNRTIRSRIPFQTVYVPNSSNIARTSKLYIDLPSCRGKIINTFC